MSKKLTTIIKREGNGCVARRLHGVVYVTPVEVAVG